MNQVDNPIMITQVKAPRLTDNILRILKVMIPVAVGTTALYLFLVFQTGDNRLWGAVGSGLAYFIINLISLRLIRRERPILAAQLLVFGLTLCCIVFTLFIAGFGLTLAVTAMLIGLLIANMTLPQKQANQTLIINIGLSIAIVPLDLYLSLDRLAVPILELYLPIIAGGLALIYSYFIARQFSSYSLQTKLILAFLVVSALSVGTGIFFMSRDFRQTINENAGSRLKNTADTQALAVGVLLERQLDRLQALSASQNLQNEVTRFNAAYEGSPEVIRDQLKELDQHWQTALSSDPLIQDRLHNEFAIELLAFRDYFPEHIEVFVTDKQGALVAATNRTSDYYHADEEWWQSVFNDGQGANYIGQPAFDQSAGKFAFIIAVPLRSHNRGEVIGVVRTTYRLGALRKFLDSAQLKQAGYADLYLPDGRIFSVSNVGPAAPNAEYLASVKANATTDYALFDYKNNFSLVSQSPVRTEGDEKAVTDLGWTLVVHQRQQVALAPIDEQFRTALILALLIMAAAALAALGVAHLLAGPITRLTGVAAQVAAGNLNAHATVESGDEIGTLATSFNTMTKQLREFIDSLESRVSARTQQLETMVRIGQRLTGILDLSDLLREVVNRTKETFNYYHVHIYLLDEKGEMLLLAQGYGEAGAEMKARGHNISMAAPKSLVAQAAREGQVVSVADVRADPNWLPNPLLPETRSEMAVPIILGSHVVGVLDVQSERAHGLGQEDETTLQALANQVAVAVRNARLFTETQDALYEAQRLQQLYTGQSWEKLLTSRSTNYEFRQSTLPALKEVSTPEAVAALKQKQTVELRLPSLAQATEGQGGGSPEVQAPAALATPLKLRDQIIGVLGIQSDDLNRQWTADEIALIEAVSEQMSLAIENARLFEESQRNAWRDQIISESTAKVWSSAEIEEVMRIAVAQLGEKLRASEVVIRLGTPEELEAW
jgi:GAF domain-containing protein/HAMP domain-containing protein